MGNNSGLTTFLIMVIVVSLAFNLSQCSKNEHSIDNTDEKSNKTIDSLKIDNLRIDSLLKVKPSEYTLIKVKYVETHDTINTNSTYQNSVLLTKKLGFYIDNRERFSIGRFKND